MKRRTSRLLSILLALCLTLAMFPGTTWAAEPKVEGLGVTSHTVAEIRAFIDAHPASLDDPVTYKTEPSLSKPYVAGVLSDETAASALNMLNQARFIAGLHADVTLDERYSDLASAATLLNRLGKMMTHYPLRPDVMASAAYDQLYEDGALGARSSNLAMGHGNLTRAIIRGWLSDIGSSNIYRLGHRRWALNPKLEKTGFGYTDSYSAMYAIEGNGSGNEYNVAWPAQVMPVEYFSANYPWSLSLGSSVNEDDVSVKLVRRSDNTTWNFSSGGAGGAFYVNNENYGAPGCIIFRPDSLSEIEDGDVFDVAVTIRDAAQPREIRYSVSFFNLNASYTADSTCPVTGGNLYFDSATGIITGCDATVTEAVIPGEIGGVPVTGIAGYAFQNCGSLTSVSIPGSVTSIGERAFDQCGALTSVSIPGGVASIEEGTFYQCGALTSVSIPGSVASIGKSAFDQCYSLASVSIPDSVTSIGERAFASCTSLTGVSIPGSVASIERYAFEYCYLLTSLDIQNGVIGIEDNAFYHCNALTSITIPGSVTSIGFGAFASCYDLTGVGIPASVTSIGAGAFWGCSNLADVYYGGSESQWKQIEIENSDTNNDFLMNANIHYNSTGPAPLAPAGISVTLNGVAVVWTDAEPFIDENGRTMVPLRAVADALGIEVNWDEDTREASFTDGAKTIWFPIDSDTARVSDGDPKKMDTAAVIVSERTYAPIRYLAEYFGYSVDWNAAARAVIITG